MNPVEVVNEYIKNLPEGDPLKKFRLHEFTKEEEFGLKSCIEIRFDNNGFDFYYKNGNSRTVAYLNIDENDVLSLDTISSNTSIKANAFENIISKMNGFISTERQLIKESKNAQELARLEAEEAINDAFSR